MFIRFSSILLACATISATVCITPARARYTEEESNDLKTSANIVDLGTAMSETISGVTANNSAGEADYFRINTAYTTPGIYRNEIKLDNATQVVGSIRGLNQNSMTGIGTTEFAIQTSQTSGSFTPYGVNQYYSFGGAGKTQSVYYRVSGTGTSVGGAYTATFSSTLVTPTALGNFREGSINLSALANVGSGGGVTNTEVVVFDANYNVYYDNVAGSPTFGYAAMNDNTTLGFNLNRSYSAGTYYIAVGIANVATNDAAPSDEAPNSRGSLVLDFDNVILSGSPLYNNNNGLTRPSNFAIMDSTGYRVATSNEVVSSLYALNFYSFTVSSATVVPEASTVALVAIVLPIVGGMTLVHRKKTA